MVTRILLFISPKIYSGSKYVATLLDLAMIIVFFMRFLKYDELPNMSFTDVKFLLNSHVQIKIL